LQEAANATGNTQSSSLRDVVAQAIANNPDVRAAAYNRLARNEEVVQARAGYLPSLDLDAGAGIDDVKKPVDETIDPRSARLSLRQNIFAGFGTKNEIERQKARVEAQAYIVRDTANNVALQTADAFLQALRNQELVNLAKENLVMHERIADQIRLRSESGVDRRADQDQIQSRLNLAKSNLIINEQNLEDARSSFMAVTGFFPGLLEKPRQVNEDMLPPSLDEAQQKAVAAHPRLLSANMDVEARREQDQVSWSAFLPVVDLEVDKTYEKDTDYSSDYSGDEREDLRLFLRLRYNFFNGWKDKARKSETEQLIQEAREIRSHTHRQTVESTRLSWQSWQSTQKRIEFLRRRAAFARSTAEAYAKQWNISQRTLLDVLDAEAERIDAAQQLVAAEYDGLYAECRILNSLGLLLPALGVPWPDEGALQGVVGEQIEDRSVMGDANRAN
jgi:adhesin transport system outer membrane protein